MMPRPIPALVWAAAAVLLGGCATAQNPDPLESINRPVFAFNEVLDEAVLAPAARGYKAITPPQVRTGVDNVFNNFRDIWTAINQLLQGKGEAAASSWMRFATNTTMGLGGLIDVATPLGLARGQEDLGQTLGHYGLASGAYLVLPLFGPSSLRDVSDLPFGTGFSPAFLARHDSVRLGVQGLRIVDLRAQLLGSKQTLDDVALDKYSFVREAYLQRRLNLVHDGNPPLPPQEERFDLPEPTPAR